ncbi:MAG TPA: hypothetical protein P5318_11865 [Candidatus Hydrogenedentes bacterium]|nr:hypothetical protein [Candidatus Hydrogenedentota bacterium]HRT20813.1 hypothetical protein [Candidatus Hydrogenedentota bacterium]HRT66106.1 hypothetical protein [Candidatus Hydrogenedentota bacterium]
MARGVHTAAIAWGFPGFALQMYGLYVGDPVYAIGGACLLVAGLMCLSRAKGYSAVWGLWGLVPVMGPLFVLFQPRSAGSTIEETIDRLMMEKDPSIRVASRRAVKPMIGGWPLLAVMTPIGVLLMVFCGGIPDAAAPVSETQMTLQTPEPPSVPPEVVSVPVSAPEPPPAPPVTPPPADPEKPKSAAEKYSALKLGMTYEEIRSIIGSDATPISGSFPLDAIVKWRNADKSYFAARFRGGRLDRLTSLVVPPLEKKNEEMLAELVPAREAKPTTQTPTEPRHTIPGPAADSSGSADTSNLFAEFPETLPEGAGRETADETAGVLPEKKAVFRVGDKINPSTRVRKARLPKYSQQIGRGPHDVHIVNPYSYDLNVGLRGHGRRGKDLEVPAAGEALLYLPNGAYDVYYTCDFQPETLKHAGSFIVDSPPDAIVIVLR